MLGLATIRAELERSFFNNGRKDVRVNGSDIKASEDNASHESLLLGPWLMDHGEGAREAAQTTHYSRKAAYRRKAW